MEAASRGSATKVREDVRSILGYPVSALMSDDLLPAFAVIPAGPFVMGSDDGPPDERPAHAVHLDEFAIGVQLITNAEYGRFVYETGIARRRSTISPGRPRGRRGARAGVPRLRQPTRGKAPIRPAIASIIR